MIFRTKNKLKMKNIVLIVLLLVFNCKNDPKEETPEVIYEAIPKTSQTINDSLSVADKDINQNKVNAIELKQKTLIEKKDERNELQELIIEKKYFKEADHFVIDFSYPLLNETIKLTHANFNEYIHEHYIDIIGTEAEIERNKKNSICDTIKTSRSRDKRYIDYKIYNLNDQLVSILFYKENFYSGTLHPTYTFDCMNFDLNRGVFMNYDDFFVEGTEDELTIILNEEITKQIIKGKMYYECWRISNDDFFEYKDNFVVNDEYVEYYFDDCVICPSYTGSYSIKIPIMNLLSVLKKYDFNPYIL